ncbi:MAG: ferredoxin reductase [Solirubrobacteraceae bacterium]
MATPLMEPTSTRPRQRDLGRRALELASCFTTPLLPDDYLELLNPLWSTRELHGRVEAVRRERGGAVTVKIRPGIGWSGHRPGQYVRLGVEVDGVLHWRAYSITSPPDASDGCIGVTPKAVTGGTVSSFLCERIRAGAIVRLGGVEGEFVLPSPPPRRALFISAGSGVTPIASMVGELARSPALEDALHIHSVRHPEEFIFGAELHAFSASTPRYRLREWVSSRDGRLGAEGLDRACPDWRRRETFLCGPPKMIEQLRERWRLDGDPARLHVERFGLDLGAGGASRGQGGEISFCASGVKARSDGTEPILMSGERAGAKLPSGCRMGICRSCVGRLRSGSVRDLRTGRVHGQPGELLRTCVNTPEGPVEIEL